MIVVATVDDSVWSQKEIDSLKNSSLRLALLSVVRMYQNEGVYGYKISEKLLESTEGELDASNATFYAILRRMEKDGLLESQVQPSDVGPPRKHYYLTTLGIKVHDHLFLHWDRHYHFLTNLRNETLKGEN